MVSQWDRATNFNKKVKQAQEKDLLIPPLPILMWIKRLRKECYCVFQLGIKGKKLGCNCITWDDGHNICRFYLCPAMRFKKNLPWEILIPLKEE